MDPSARPIPPLFVVGYMHSGTTLLQKILERSSHLLGSVGESRYFEFLPVIRRRYPNLADAPTRHALVAFVVADLTVGGYALDQLHIGSGLARETTGAAIGPAELAELRAQTDAVRDHGAMFVRVFDALAARAGRTSWLEKTPTHIFHVAEMLAAAPDARIIEVVRDPRDILASKKARLAQVWTSDRYTDAQRPIKHLEKAYDPLLDALSWKAAIAAGRRARARWPAHVIRVAYEALVDAPDATVRALCEQIGLPFEDHLTGVRGGNSAEGTRPGIYGSSVARWRSGLAPGERALCQYVTRKELEELGYELEAPDLQAAVSAGGRLACSVSALATRVSRRLRLGDVDYARTLLRGYAKRAVALIW